MSSITGLISSGGGGGLSSDYTLDNFPVCPVAMGSIYHGTYGNSSGWTDSLSGSFWNTDARSLSLCNNGFATSTAAPGTVTVLNETGSGKLYWVTTTGFTQGTRRLIITVDGVSRTWEVTSSSNTNTRLFGGRSLENYSENANHIVPIVSSFYNGTGQQINSDFDFASRCCVQFNASGYIINDLPGLRYESSIKIEVYSSVGPGGAGEWCGGLRQKDF